MNRALVDKIVDAVLYEGYILYPYRPSVKNRQRWTFGGLYPRASCLAQGAGDRWSMQTECLLQGSASTVLQVEVRFLHLQARLVGALDSSVAELAEGEEPAFHVVENLRVGDRLLQTWEEAVERSVVLEGRKLDSLVREPAQAAFAFPASRESERVRGRAGLIEAVVVREQHAVAGHIEVSAFEIGEGVFKLVARIENDTAIEQPGQQLREQAVLEALASTHTILGVQNGDFLSLIDPPEHCRGFAAACRNEGTWPVLVGHEGETDTMLSSPITLYDYPQIARESPGDFFDGTEIDEMLVLRIQTLTDEEKAAAAAVDERARALLNRTTSLSDDQMMGLHGAVRGLRPVREEGAFP
jgi:hydrogenase maturation protease